MIKGIDTANSAMAIRTLDFMSDAFFQVNVFNELGAWEILKSIGYLSAQGLDGLAISGRGTDEPHTSFQPLIQTGD